LKGDTSDFMTLLKEKASALYEAVTHVVDASALVLGSEYSGYIFPEVYDPSMGAVANAVVIDFESDAIYAICNPLQAPAVQDNYPNVKVLVIDPLERVDIGLPTFKSDVDALMNAVGSHRIVAYAGKVPQPRGTEVTMIGVEPIVRIVRMQKLDEEVKRIKIAIEIAENALSNVLSEIAIGDSEVDIARKIVNEILKLGGDGEAFKTIVAIGKASREPHHVPSRRYKFDGGEPILVDFGASFLGYRSDITRMIVPKRVSDKYSDITKVVEAVSRSIDEALRHLKPGVEAKDVFEEARRVLEIEGDLDKQFLHGLGHGIGVEVHEEPYLSPRWDGKVLEGCVVTIEPGIYLEDFGVRIEEDVLVSEGGCIKLTKLERVLEL